MAERTRQDTAQRNTNGKKSSGRRNNGHRENAISSSATIASDPRVEKIQLLQRTMGTNAVQRLWNAGALQPYLKVGPSDDKYEKQADAMAKYVVESPAPAKSALGNSISPTAPGASKAARKPEISPTAQRMPGDAEGEKKDDIKMKPIEISRMPAPPVSAGDEDVPDVSAKGTGGGAFTASNDVSSAVNSLKSSGGSPLPQSERAFLEPRMGYDLGHVRLHTGDTAQRASEAIQAKAFTIGNHVAFNKGQYQPGTTEGRRLIAHEATHTIQQGGGMRRDVVQREPVIQREPAGSKKNELTAGEKIDRLIGTIKESYKYIPDILGDVWDHIKDHWVLFTLTILGFLAAEALIGILAGVPEPTMLTKVIAIGMQVLLFGILGYFAAVETAAATKEGTIWWNLATKPDATKAELTEASKAFLRMVLHMTLVILALIGVRVKTRVKFVKDTIKKPTKPLFTRGKTKVPSQTKTPKGKGGKERPAPAGTRLPSVRDLVKMTVEDIVGKNPEFVPSQPIASAELILSLARDMLRGKTSMLKNGIRVNPPDGGVGPWVIIDGTHRFIAARLAGIRITESMLVRGRTPRPPWKWSQVKWPLVELRKYGP